MLKNVTFHRFKKSDFNEVSKLFIKTFNKKISKIYYDWRYFRKNKFNSFIAKVDNKIVAHIGFVEYTLNSKLDKNNSKIYSRHTTMVDLKFRQQNIYYSLFKWSLNQLDKNNGIIAWPNKINILASKKLNQEYGFNYILFYKSINNSQRNHIIKFRLSKISKLDFNKLNFKKTSISKNFNIIDKNINYLYWRYFKYDNSSYYYFKKNINEIDNIFIIGKITKDNKKYFSILEYIGDHKFYYKILDELIENLKFSRYYHKSYYIQIWSDQNNSKQIEYLKKKKFKHTNNKFNISVFNSKKIIKRKLKNLQFEMGDTDVFININKNN